MTNEVAALIFCARNGKKVENGEIGRFPVAIGQANKFVNSVVNLDNAIGKGTKAAVDAFKLAAKGDKLLDYAGKGVKFASEHINPLICVSSGINILTSDDKTATFLQQAPALTTMFSVEKLMKKYMDSDKNEAKLKKWADELLKFAEEKGLGKFSTTTLGKLPAILKGTLFVIGSVSAYSAGQKFGNLLVSKVESEKSEDAKTQRGKES